MSREIDAMVAEKVFGRKVLGNAPCFQSGDDGRWFVDRDGRDLQPVYADSSYEAQNPDTTDCHRMFGVPTAWLEVVPAYSTDPAAAMEVVERMRVKAAGIDIFIRHPDNPRGHPAFCCYMHSFVESAWKEGRLDEDASAEADTLPMAVCLASLAALRAVGGEGGRKDG